MLGLYHGPDTRSLGLVLAVALMSDFLQQLLHIFCKRQ